MRVPERKQVASTAEKSTAASERLLHELDKMVDEMTPEEVNAAHERLRSLVKKARASRVQNRETA